VLAIPAEAMGRVMIGAKRRGSEVLISVSDTRMGIASQHLPHVSTPFYRAAAGGEGIPGSGLGLAVSRSIVERHVGRIWVDSAPGLGSTLSFTIPRASRSDPPAPRIARSSSEWKQFADWVEGGGGSPGARQRRRCERTAPSSPTGP
jgi:hypothetical protein